jgi:hypothetical protein
MRLRKMTVKELIVAAALGVPVSFMIYLAMTYDGSTAPPRKFAWDNPSVLIGKSYVLKTTLPACKTVETFDKVMTLHRAGDATSVNLYMASGDCNLLETGVPYAVTGSTATMVQVTRNAVSYWTPRDSFAANVDQ